MTGADSTRCFARTRRISPSASPGSTETAQAWGWREEARLCARYADTVHDASTERAPSTAERATSSGGGDIEARLHEWRHLRDDDNNNDEAATRRRRPVRGVVSSERVDYWYWADERDDISCCRIVL